MQTVESFPSFQAELTNVMDAAPAMPRSKSRVTVKSEAAKSEAPKSEAPKSEAPNEPVELVEPVKPAPVET